jgi:hypothetical protein
VKSAKVSDPLKFSNDPTDKECPAFKDWIIQVENKMAGNADWFPTETSKIIHIGGLLKGKAFSLCAVRLKQGNAMYPKSLQELYDYLVELFGDPDREQNARDAF